MPGLAYETLAEIQEVFRLYDDRGDNHIPKRHLGEAIRALGLNPTEGDIHFFLNDLQRVERVSIQQFQVIFERLYRVRHDVPSANEFTDGLRAFDKDGNGVMPATELRHLLTSLGDRLTDDEVEQLMEDFEDRNGMIAYEDFIQSVLQR